MLEHAIFRLKGPVAVRYPRGGEGTYTEDAGLSPSTLLRPGRDITLTGYGATIEALLDCAGRLEQRGVSPEIVKLNTITPLPLEAVAQSVKKTGRLLAAEECTPANSVGRRLAAHLLAKGIPVKGIAFADIGPGFVTHGTTAQLRRLCGLDGESLYRKAWEVCGNGNG